MEKGQKSEESFFLKTFNTFKAFFFDTLQKRQPVVPTDKSRSLSHQ